MELIIHQGRPEDVTGRAEKEIRVYDVLDGLGIEYQRIDHEAKMTMEACEDVDRLLKIRVAKNLFLCNRQKTAYYLLLMPGDKVFRTKELSAQINSARLSFASPEDMGTLLNLTPGSVSVTGLLSDSENKVRLLVDEDILKEEYFGCHPSMNTSSICLKTEDVFGKFLAYTGHDMTVVHLEGR